MLDCEFCSDALEGMKYAQNSSMIFAIDNQIDQRVKTGKAGTSMMKNLMVAASILIIVFGAYFTFDYFDTTANNQANLAINNYEIKEENEVEKAIEKPTINSTENNQENMAGTASDLNETFDKSEILKDNPSRVDADQPPSVPMVEEVLEEEVEESSVYYDALVEKVENDLPKETQISSKLYKEENKQLEDRSNNVAADAVKSAPSANQPNTTVEANLGYLSVANESKDKDEASKKSNKKRSESKNKGKKRFKAKSEAPSYAQQDNFTDEIEEKTDLSNNRNQNQTITLSNHKVVDYTEEYQKEYDLKQVIETKSVTADFETEEDAAEAEKELDETTIEITYKATLEKAMAYYNAKKYTLALKEFDIILKEHPNEVNALFYSGLSEYHLQRYQKASGKLDRVLTNPKTQFNQEAEWYKALTLIELKKTDEAKKLLQKISNSSGFYKLKAKEQLKKLN